MNDLLDIVISMGDTFLRTPGRPGKCWRELKHDASPLLWRCATHVHLISESEVALDVDALRSQERPFAVVRRVGARETGSTCRRQRDPALQDILTRTHDAKIRCTTKQNRYVQHDTLTNQA